MRVGRSAGIVGTLVAAGIAASAAHGAELVADGGFEGATCVGAECTSPAWVETKDYPGGGPICIATAAECNASGGPRSGAHFGRFGAVAWAGDASASLEQSLAIAEGSTTLSFHLQSIPYPGRPGSLTVSVNATPLRTFSTTEPGFAQYSPVSLDVSAFAGGPSDALRFAFTSAAPQFVSETPGFLVDDISLIAPDAAPPPRPPETPTCGGRPATIVGTATGGELLRGTRENDVIVALDGADVIKAGRGKDVVCGGGGGDEISGGAGNDKLYGQGGRDKLKGQGGRKDLCSGGGGKDRAAATCERTPGV